MKPLPPALVNQANPHLPLTENTPMTRLLLTLAAIASLAATGSKAQNAVTPPPHAPTERTNILMDVPGSPGVGPFAEGLSIDFGAPAAEPEIVCENVFETVDGARELVGVRCTQLSR